MIIKFLHWKRAVFSVLITLLLSVAGVTNAMAQTFTVGNLNYSLNNDGASVTVLGHVDGTAATGELVIPESVELYGTTYPVTVIGSSAFYNCSGLTGSLAIPNSVVTIGSYAFQNCYGFTGTLTIGNVVQSIGYSAFQSCYGFTGLTLGNSVQSIYEQAFADCTGFVGALTIPESLTYTNFDIFTNCTGFTSLNYNATNCNLAYSGGSEHWLLGCSSLTTVIIGENVQVIPTNFLKNCTSFVGELVIPNSVTSIGENAFNGCTGLTGSLAIPGSVTSIGNNAFNGCSGFNGSLIIGNSVTSIGENAFNGCSGITGSLTIPNSVNSVGVNAFSGCTGFSGTLTIGNSVTQIGNTAFFGACEGFTSFVVLPETPPTLGNNVFVSADYGLSVAVPCGSLEAYQGAEGWNLFTNIQEQNPCLWGISAESSPASGGTVNGTGVYEQGQTCTLLAIPNDDFSFVNWTENGVEVSTDAEYAFTVTENRHLVANFIINNLIGGGTATNSYLPSYSYYPYSLTQQIYTADEIGQMGVIEKLSFFNGGYAMTRNYDIYLVHTEKTNFSSATDWAAVTNVDKVFSGNVNMVSNDWTTITFDTPFAYNGTSNVILVVDDNTGNWNSGLACRVFNATSQAIRISGDGTNYNPSSPSGYNGSIMSVKNQIAFGFSSVDAAVFATVSPEEAGSVSGEGVYPLGGTCTLTATPSSNDYVFVNWTENGEVVSNNAQYSFTVTNNRNLVANFLQFRVDIAVSTNPEEGGTVSGAGSYLLGQTCTLTATPNEDYAFVNWTENDVVVSTNATYSFAVVCSRDLVAHFRNIRYEITASANPEEGGSINGAGSYLEGETCTLTATPNDGYVFVNWMENGQEISTNASYSFTVTGSRTLVVCFMDPVGTVQALYYPDNTNPGSPYVRVSWQSFGPMIGDEASTNSTSYMPFYTLYNYSISESLFTADELAQAGVTTAPMTSLSWEAVEVTTNQNQNNISIWMANVSDTQLTTTSHLASNMTLVYTGNIGIPPLGWNEFVFNEGNFAWDGISNVLVLVQRNNGQWNGTVKWRSHNPGFYSMTYRYQDNTPYNATTQTYTVTCINTNRPNTMFKGIGFDISNYYYNVYRTDCDSNTYSLIADSVSESMYTDSLWLQLPLGSYQYGVSFIKDDGSESGIVASNCIERSLYTYQIAAIPNLASRGTVSGAGEYALGATCMVTATPIGNNTFTCWKENGTVVSTDANYSFIVSGPRNLVAVFSVSPDDIIVFADNNVKTLCVNNWDIDGDGELAYDEAATVTNLGNVFQNKSGIISFNELQYFTGLTSIGQQAFYNCYNLNSITLPNGVTSIGYRAFYGCSSLAGTHDFPNAVTSIGEEAFMDCTSITGLNLPAYLSSIGSSAFRNCSGIRGEITLPASLWSVGGYAFYGCDGISTVNYNATNCYSFGSASTPVFYDCAFPHLNIGANVQSIPDYAFKRCFMITDMNVAAANPPTVYSSTFGMVPRSIPVTVPFGSGDAYRSAQYWEEFFNIIEDNGTVYTNHWQPNGSQYANNMSVIGIIQIDGVEQSTNALEIGAFCGDECRGSQLLTYYPQLNRYLVFFTLYGEEGDILFFRLYDHELDQESDLGCASYITFESNGILGTYSSPYVFNFAYIQNTMLDAGWAWFSSYVELNGLDGLSMMEESLGSNGLMIKSQSDGYASYSNTIGQWSGSLSSVNNEQMYMINISAPCVLNITGSYAVPTQHPIVLSPGWTWIGYPLTSATSINEALSGLNAQDGDVIKSKSSFSTYIEGVGWTGWLNTFNPGFGMMYYSQNNGPISFVYADGAKSGAFLENLTAEGNHYESILSAYPNNMNVIAVVELEGMEIRNGSFELASFAGNECRGSVRLLYVEALDRYIAFLTVAGDQSALLNWRLYDTETGMEYGCEQSIMFEANGIIGNLALPVVLNFSKMTGAEEQFAGHVSMYPNPARANELVHITLPLDSKARLELVNVMGAVVSAETVMGGSTTLKAPDKPGVYMVKVIFDGKGTYTYKLVVE